MTEDDLEVVWLNLDGAETLADAAWVAEEFAERLRYMHAEGWTCRHLRSSGYIVAEPPRWFQELPDELTVETYSALPEEIQKRIEVVNGRPVMRK